MGAKQRSCLRKRKVACKTMNLPNALTVMRLLLVPAFYYLYQRGLYVWALAAFLTASFTDFLDGYLARKWNQITSFGKLADPFADKVMVLTALYCLAADGRIPWAAPIVILAKEACMVLGGLLMLRRKVVVQANIWGKAATVAFIAALTLCFPWHGVQFLYDAGRILIWISVGLSVFAMVQYAWGIVKNWSAH